ncbi:hypothetical protein AABD41_14995 [Staphylococcus pseudoxylosus]|uniref:hypothetical protein n=1 Tax=Staphylococcus pseudoxylosus TaxID=2282419 RepID=UPI00398ACEE2
MSYEYEWDEIEIVVKEDYEELKRKARALDEIMKGELGAYYDKTKAFDAIRNVEDKYYEEHEEFISTEDFVYAVDTILNNYKRSESADDER